MSGEKSNIENATPDALTEQLEVFSAQAQAFDDLSDQELEARISKERGGSGGNAYC